MRQPQSGQYALVRTSVVWGLVVVSALVVLGAGCGGSSHPSGAPVPTTRAANSALLARVLEVTNHIGRFRFSEIVRYQTTDGGGGLSMHGSGVSDIATGVTEDTVTGSANVAHLSKGGAPTFSAAVAAESFVLTSSREYDRIVGPPPGAHDWCWRTPKKTPGPGVSPIATLATLAKSGGTVVEVGRTVVRGVSTTHYAVSGGGRASPVDIWVDSSDELRRIHWTQTGPTSTQTMTTDLFDFGAPVTIRTPVNAPACNP